MCLQFLYLMTNFECLDALHYRGSLVRRFSLQTIFYVSPSAPSTCLSALHDPLFFFENGKYSAFVINAHRQILTSIQLKNKLSEKECIRSENNRKCLIILLIHPFLKKYTKPHCFARWIYYWRCCHHSTSIYFDYK